MVSTGIVSPERRLGAILIVSICILALLPLAASILINPSLESAYKFARQSGQTSYSYFAEHPPILSEDEAFLLVLTQDATDLKLNLFRSDRLKAGPRSVASLGELLKKFGINKPPVKIELHALPMLNYVMNYLYHDGEDTISVVSVLSYDLHTKKWAIEYVLSHRRHQPEFRTLAHVKPIHNQNFPLNLMPTDGENRGLDECKDILWWMEDDMREFVLCPYLVNSTTLSPHDPLINNQSDSTVFTQYRPRPECFQYLAPWHEDPTDERDIVSVARLDSTGLVALIDDITRYSLVHLRTDKCPPPKPHHDDSSDPTADQCSICVIECQGVFGKEVPFVPGPEAPALLVPDTGTGRLMAYSCSNASIMDAEPFPVWLSENVSTEVADCVFTIYHVNELPQDTEWPDQAPSSNHAPHVPHTPVAAPSSHDPHHNSFTSHRSRFELDLKRNSGHPPPEDPHHSPPPPASSGPQKVCTNLQSLPWISELYVSDPLTLTLAANRTVRFSFNGDLLYATHFTRDGISSISILDVSNGGAFEQGSLPLDTDAPEGPYINSFSDDVDISNQFLYATGFYYDFRSQLSTPAIYRYDVSPRGQPSLLSQIYVQSKSGTTPTSNYMLPIPQLPGITVVAAPREVIIKQVSASSLSLKGAVITYQYTSFQVLDINVVRPVLSQDGSRILIFCQTLGLNYTDSILSAYIMDVVVTPLGNTSGVPQSDPPRSSSPPTHHARFSQEIGKQVRQFADSTFGSNTRVEMDELESQIREHRRQASASSFGSSTASSDSYSNWNSNTPVHGDGETPSWTTEPPMIHESPPSYFPPINPRTPFNMTVNVTLNVRCRFWISNRASDPDVPIGASFVGKRNDRVVIVFTSPELGSEDTHIHVYNLSMCKGAHVGEDEPIPTTHLTRLEPLAKMPTTINWDSMPFADQVLNSNFQTGDSPGVRFWDIPTYELPDSSIIFWLSNQSLNVGIGGASIHHPEIDPTDYSSTVVQYLFDGITNTLSQIAVSDPLDCSPVTSQVIPDPTPLLPNVPINQTSVWVLCQWVAKNDPTSVLYSVIDWHLSSPEVPDLTLSPTITVHHPPQDDRKYDNYDYSDDDSRQMSSPYPPPRLAHMVRHGFHRLSQPITSTSINLDNSNAPVGSTGSAPWYDVPFTINDTAVWYLDVNSNISILQSWSKATPMNFYVQWKDRRVYLGNSFSFNIIAITEDERSVMFGRALFTSAKLVNSLMAWWQFPGFGFLGDIQWIWVVSECTTGTKLAATGYCSKCSPGSFGIGCGECTPGYLCDDFGLLVPDSLCDEGYYCPGGTSKLNGYSNQPKICPAGFYCPGGVASDVVGSVNSVRRCSAGFYCPAGSKVPNAMACAGNSTSLEGSATVHDCTCIPGYIGSSGNCRRVLDGGSVVTDDSTLENYMTYEIGYYPAGLDTPHGVQFLEDCPLNREACNARVLPDGLSVPIAICNYTCGHSNTGHGGDDGHGGHHFKRNGGGGEHDAPDCIVTCNTSLVCQTGYTGRLCSKCAVGYYERGHVCSDCYDNKKLGHGKTIALVVVAALIIVVLLALVVIGQAFIALILELLSMILLNSIGLVPIWLLDVLFIFVLVYFINRGKRYNALIKLQEETAAKRKLKLRAKRMAQKRREARVKSGKFGTLRKTTNRLTGSYSAPQQPAAVEEASLLIKEQDAPPKSAVVRRVTIRGAPNSDNETDPENVALLMPDAPVPLEDQQDGLNQDHVARGTGLIGQGPTAVALDDEEDPPLPIEDDFLMLATDDEDYHSEASMDEEELDEEEMAELEAMVEAELAQEEQEEDEERYQQQRPTFGYGPTRKTVSYEQEEDDDAPPYRSPRSAHVSQRSFGKPAGSIKSGKIPTMRRAPEDAHHDDHHHGSQRYGSQFGSATGHHQDFTHETKEMTKGGDHSGHDDDGSHGHGHGEHGEHEYISEGLIKSFLFFLQTSEALGEGLFKWTELVANLQQFSPFQQVALFDCVYPDLFSYDKKFIMYMALLPVLTIVMFLMYLLGVARMEIVRRRKIRAMNRDVKMQESRFSFLQMSWANEDETTSLRTGATKEEIAKMDAKRRRLRYRWARIWLFFVSVFYFELTEGILKVFRCEEDLGTEKSYMESEPWLVCDIHTYPYSFVKPLAIAGLVVYTIGIPVLFFYLLFHHRKRLHNPKVMSWLGMLYEEYQPHLWWFEMTMIARRVCIALVIAIVPSESEFGPVMIMVILMAAMGTNIWFRAFVSDAENTVDLMAMCVMMITYLGGVVQRSNQNYEALIKTTRGVTLGGGHHGGGSTTNSTSLPTSTPQQEALAAQTYRAEWKRLPPLEIFLFCLNMVMFLIYLGVLLRPRIKTMYHWCLHRYQDWARAREEKKNAHLAAHNASINIAQTDDEEDHPMFSRADAPLLHTPQRDI